MTLFCLPVQLTQFFEALTVAMVIVVQISIWMPKIFFSQK